MVVEFKKVTKKQNNITVELKGRQGTNKFFTLSNDDARRLQGEISKALLKGVTEEWLYIPGFGEKYKVSNMGKLWSCERKRLLATNVSNSGYIRTILINEKREKVSGGVHRFIALAFLDKIKGKEHVNHINGIKHDNRAQNLEWCTPSENVRHALNTGLIKKSINNNRKLSSEDVVRIREIKRETMCSNAFLAKKYNVSEVTIHYIISGKKYRGV